MSAWGSVPLPLRVDEPPGRGVPPSHRLTQTKLRLCAFSVTRLQQVFLRGTMEDLGHRGTRGATWQAHAQRITPRGRHVCRTGPGRPRPVNGLQGLVKMSSASMLSVGDPLESPGCWMCL